MRWAVLHGNRIIRSEHGARGRALSPATHMHMYRALYRPLYRNQPPTPTQVDAGVEKDLVFGDPNAPRFVFWEGKLRPVPSGLDAFTFDLMSIVGKIRAGLGAIGLLNGQMPGAAYPSAPFGGGAAFVRAGWCVWCGGGWGVVGSVWRLSLLVLFFWGGGGGEEGTGLD